MHAILVPVDGSVHALKALRIACDLAEKYGGRIVLLHILTEGRSAGACLALPVAPSFGPKLTEFLKKFDAGTPVTEPVLKEIGKRIIQDAENRVERRTIAFDALDIQSGDPAQAILKAAADIKAGTIVMGSRGVRLAEGSTFGSVSHRVFEEADCTCLSVK